MLFSRWRPKSTMTVARKSIQIGLNHPPTLTPLTSSSSNEPMSNASAAFTSPRGGISGGVN